MCCGYGMDVYWQSILMEHAFINVKCSPKHFYCWEPYISMGSKWIAFTQHSALQPHAEIHLKLHLKAPWSKINANGAQEAAVIHKEHICNITRSACQANVDVNKHASSADTQRSLRISAAVFWFPDPVIFQRVFFCCFFAILSYENIQSLPVWKLKNIYMHCYIYIKNGLHLIKVCWLSRVPPSFTLVALVGHEQPQVSTNFLPGSPITPSNFWLWFLYP